MRKVYTGKTKDVYVLDNGNYCLQFKDTVTGSDGVFDPGANTVGLTIDGIGQLNLAVSKMFFELLADKGIATHYLSSDLGTGRMEVVPTTFFGQGVEVICRYRAVGSFYRRYGKYIDEGAPLDAYVEVTLKDDDRNDPLITAEGLEALGIMSRERFEELVVLTRQITAVVAAKLKSKGLELYDIKFEFGLSPRQELLLIDEISSGNMRAYKDGNRVDPKELSRLLLAD
ncbi:MAG: phosphoribosylaminoimidazolesuccinocarboxamide synthase [Saccharofermentanales bacterium]|jgi:phosphoribosylaminoimidazole-succinocarboxamide synthase|nr:phosphoribosylaminoimidazolesuccinocarboxamide synthase [Bacillota bacterium]NLB08923.1 phosphoribosylaminoimidazolesuccinocarboxamide synthase [Clostridiales bacterium]